jgi:hypothetical protein
VDCQRCINLYPETNEIGTGKAREVAALNSTPGLLLLQTIGLGPYRGLFYASNDILYAVVANKIYSVSSAWAATELGTLNSSEGQVSMADNGTSLVIVDGVSGYVVTLSGGAFVEITDPEFFPASHVGLMDGYFIFSRTDTGQFFISALNDTTFDALDIATAEGAPDNIIGLLVNNRDLWLAGTDTIEVWFNSGDADFPFQRIQGAFIEVGLAAAFSLAKMQNTIYWLGQDKSGSGMVFEASGYQPKRISTHAIEQAIQGYSSLSDAVAWTYQQNGHFFYVLSFPTANTTWVYDATTSMWHERVYTNQGDFERHRAVCHAFAYGKHVVGDYENGKLFELSETTYSDNGSAITRQRITPHATQDTKRLFFKSFQVDMETGVGLDGTGQGTDPKLMLQFSDDGGHSWSNEKWADIGKIGKRLTRAIFRRLGQSRDRVFKVTITDPIKVTFIGAEVDVEEGAN